MKENRSISGIYHLLSGKKSIQSVHDAKIFNLEGLYGIYPALTMIDFLDCVQQMVAGGLIKKGKTDNYYDITDRGEQYLKQSDVTSILCYFNGIKYYGRDVTFLERLFLIIQTLSNIQKGNTTFIPVIDRPSITNWTKKFYTTIKGNRRNFTIKLYEELYELLNQLPEKEANIFVDRLSGYKYYGMSVEQLSEKHSLTKHDVILYLTGVTHHLIVKIEQNQERFTVLYSLLRDLEQTKFITNTAKQTYQLLCNHFTVSEIASMRNLKLNTIYDHIVEIVLYDKEFTIDTFVTKQEQAIILQAIHKYNTYKLKIIKDNTTSSISYFQIRLVLARLEELRLEGPHV
ncbi:helix-turn-helix domain-containing protein [Ornithinibacillus sp. 16A2E]|uniref:Helix-turn-helix domain-containing protein n=2 Tax=Ornithinibacillus xuwenensis TaxID=3144668 RepID=A0ABU9XD19_9BACI